MRSHPASDVGLHRQIFVLLFSTLPLQAHSAKATSSQGPSADSASLAAAAVGNAHSGWQGKAKCHLPSKPHSLLAPGKAQRPAQAGGGKTPNFGLQVIEAMKAFLPPKSQFGFFQHLTYLLRALEIWPKVSAWPEKQFYINNSPTKSPFPSTYSEFSHCAANNCHTPEPKQNPWLGRK